MSKELIELIKSSKNILISGHTNADYDSLGSTLSMYEICQQLLRHSSNLQITPVIWEDYKYQTLNLPFAENLKQIDPENDRNWFVSSEFDLMVFVDIGELRRLPFVNEIESYGCPIIVLDHHVDSCQDHLGIIEYVVNKNARSTTTVIYEDIIRNSGLEVTQTLAQNLLTGIYGDTDFLLDTGIKPSNLRMIADLVELGASLDDLIVNVTRTKKISKEKALALAMMDVQIEEDKFSYLVLDFAKLSAIERQTGYAIRKADLIDQLRCFEGIQFGVIILEERKDFLTCSLKTRLVGVDIEPIARHFGGGGHEVAAAFRFDTDDFVKDASGVLDYIRKYT